MQHDAAPAPRPLDRRKRAAPAGLLGDQVEQRELARMLGEQLAPELVGVPPGGVGHLVEHALEHEGIEAVPDRAPEADRHVRVLEHVVDPEVRNPVRLVRRALERDRVKPVLDELREHPAHDRGRHAAVLPGDDPTAVVDPDLDPVQAGRAVEAVLHVLFAGPDQLHRPADRLGYGCRLEREVELEAPAEAAAKERGVNDDRVGRQLVDLRQSAGERPLALGRRPDLHPPGRDVRGRVHRLHGGVRQKRQGVFGLDHFGGAGQGLIDFAALRADRGRRRRSWSGTAP